MWFVVVVRREGERVGVVCSSGRVGVVCRRREGGCGLWKVHVMFS